MLTAKRSRRREDAHPDEGFTLIELVITVSIMLVVMVALTGMVISYLTTTKATQGRLTESHDVQFAAAYWQRDVASIGVRSTTYCQLPTDPGCAGTTHSYRLLQSVNVAPACSMPAGTTTVVTLAWSSYVVATPNSPTTVTVTYVTKSFTKNGLARKQLIRVRCTGSTQNSSTSIANNLTADPVVGCPLVADSCTGSGSAVPTAITMKLVSDDPANPTASDYTATLTGERRAT